MGMRSSQARRAVEEAVSRKARRAADARARAEVRGLEHAIHEALWPYLRDECERLSTVGGSQDSGEE